MITMVMTGGTSGFGKITLRKLLKPKDTRILLGARRNIYQEGIETLPLDLSKLESVRSFAADVCSRLGKNEINALIMNAGVSLSGNSKTIDGFETTFAVNHLAHYLLLRLLMPRLADGARIILTTSGTYDPAEKTMIPPPLHANAKLLAYPELDPNLDSDQAAAAGRAYSSSKLCTMLTVRFLKQNPEAVSRKWTVIAYDPGPTPGTGLVRGNNPLIRAVWYLLGTPFLRPFLSSMNSRKASGGALADLALGKISMPEGRIYAALRRGKIVFPELSELANRDDLMQALWNDSAVLAGFSGK
jgi:NAD(P)-dependent dehydrogenase (short-subunit alcohol dehydrogenase family)